MILNMLWILLSMVGCGAMGAVFGLIPFFVGKNSGKPLLGRDGMFCCIGAGVSLIGAPFIPAVVAGFIIAIMVKDTDRRSSGHPVNQPYVPPGGYGQNAGHNLGVRCVCGPLMGQTYGVTPQGMIIGRDHDCAIRFPAEYPGISRHHCSLRWEGSALMLTDMGSSHGTFLSTGARLPAQLPTQVPLNTRFYLANTGNMFQIVIM